MNTASLSPQELRELQLQKNRERVKKYRERHPEKYKQLQARYYYSHRSENLEAYGYRLTSDDPRAKGPFDPIPLRRKMIQISATNLRTAGGGVGMLDFNSFPVFPTSEIISPIKNSLFPIINDMPNLPENFFSTLPTLLGTEGLGSGGSSLISSGIKIYFGKYLLMYRGKKILSIFSLK